MAHSPLTWRTLLSVGGVAVLLILEQWIPFKPPTDSKWRRYARNIFITVSNALVLEVALGGSIIAYIGWLGSRNIGLLHVARIAGSVNIIATVLALDLSTYWFHRAYHEVAGMWRLHRVHHSDLDLDVTSASRFHLAEIMLSTAYRIAVLAALGPTVIATTIFEATLLAQSQLQHSNLKLPDTVDAALRWLIVTPDMHRVHHSQIRRHTNSNYSTVFSFWDRWFGTYIVEGVQQEGIKIGLPEYSVPDVTIGKLLIMPLGAPCAAEHSAAVGAIAKTAGTAS